MQSYQSTINKTILTLLASLTLIRASNILNGIQIPENPGDYIIHREYPINFNPI